ncbi:esterase [Pelagibacteraceae bacterium]|nr:esterase [Pelagibacteraceae bacterium]
MNLNIILSTLADLRNYIFPVKRFTDKYRKIESLDHLKNFVRERSAHVTQTTLYGYIKTRIGSRHTLMFEDDVFVKSVNIAKWNILLASLSDCTLFTFSYLVDKKNYNQNEAEKIFNSILEEEEKNGLDFELSKSAKRDFINRLKEIDWKSYHKNEPFKKSGLALYKWSPIADNLKELDKEIVLNSIKLKWNIVENEFKEFTKDLKFN